MARPRKSSDGNDARQRICKALWDLLEEHELRDITVGMITAQAACNRGTFYYHFRDLDDLLNAVIADDVLRKSTVAELIFRITSSDEAAVRKLLAGQPLQRLSIVVNHAGIETAFGKLFESLESMWRTILCPDGTPLKPEVQAILLYYVGGVLSMVAMLAKDELDEPVDNEEITRFVMVNARFIMEQICLAQGLSIQVAHERIATIVQFIDSTR